jgi:hypothetical protein
MSPSLFWLGIVGGLVILWIVVVVTRDCVAYRRRLRERRPTPWYALQVGNRSRWTPWAWKQACDLSTKNSRARRG